MYAYDYQTVSASSYGIAIALTLVASVYVLGVTLVQGAVLGGFGAIGAVVPLIFQKWILPADRISIYVQLIVGVGLLLQLKLFPDGLLVSAALKKEEGSQPPPQRWTRLIRHRAGEGVRA